MRTPSMRKRLVVSAAVVAATVGSVLTMTVPAQASGPSECPQGTSCLWRDSGQATNGNYAAFIKIARYSSRTGTLNYAGTTLNGHDSVSSMYNNGAWDNLWMYRNENYSGASWQRRAATGDTDYANGSPLDSSGNSVNDAMDSVIYQSEK